MLLKTFMAIELKELSYMYELSFIITHLRVILFGRAMLGYS